MKALIFLAVLTIFLPVNGQEKRPHSASNQKAANPESPASQVVVVDQENTNGQTNGATDHPKSYFSRLFSPENLPNIGLFIVGFFGVIIAVCTLKAIQGQLGEIKAAGAQTDKMIEHAEAQASTAKDSLDLSRDTAKKQLRAYLSVSEAMIKFNSEWILEPQLHVTNAGQTPAYDVRQWLKTKIDELPPRWIPHEQPEELPEGGAVIGATHKSIMVAQAFEVPEDRQPSFGTKYAVLWVYGRISYRDVFGDRHYTDFRLFYGGPGIRNRQKNGENWGLLQRHSEGNGAT